MSWNALPHFKHPSWPNLQEYQVQKGHHTLVPSN